MEMSWSTFVLEIVNFLVLVWILKRFLYKPVLDVIARRRAGIEKTLSEAAAQREEAESLQKRYEGRLADWDRERQQAQSGLAQEIEAERSRRLEELRVTLGQERDKAQRAEQRRLADEQRKIEETAMLHGARFATRLLEQTAGPETETRLVELALTGLAELPPERLDALRNNHAGAAQDVVVSSAFPLADEQRERLSQALAGLAGDGATVSFEQDQALLAGLRITIGAWVLAANLRDELQGFAELAHAY